MIRMAELAERLERIERLLVISAKEALDTREAAFLPRGPEGGTEAWLISRGSSPLPPQCDVRGKRAGRTGTGVCTSAN